MPHVDEDVGVLDGLPDLQQDAQSILVVLLVLN